MWSCSDHNLLAYKHYISTTCTYTPKVVYKNLPIILTKTAKNCLLTQRYKNASNPLNNKQYRDSCFAIHTQRIVSQYLYCYFHAANPFLTYLTLCMGMNPRPSHTLYLRPLSGLDSGNYLYVKTRLIKVFSFAFTLHAPTLTD